MRRLLVLAVLVSSGCFSPKVPTDGVTAEEENEPEPEDSTSSSTTTGQPDTDPTTGGPDAPEGTSSPTSELSTSGSTGEEASSSSSEGSSSTGPDEPTPYGQCTPGTEGWQVECPEGNSDLGCGVTANGGSMCMPDCTDAPDSCPDTGGPTPPFCVQLIGGRYACLVLCQEDGHCPDGMVCDELGASSVCSWPA